MKNGEVVTLLDNLVVDIDNPMLCGRYSKHFWPEDPLLTHGTTATKRNVLRLARNL